jgi:DNA-directed RNA polymerase specialized sigma24 family protein
MRDGCDTVSLCQAAVRQLINDFNWQLLPEEEFVARSAKTLAENPAMTPIQACLNVYSRQSYDDCQDVRRQEQAYRELDYYLRRIACRRRPNLAEDATQEALRLVFEQIDTCRNPGAFLRFAQFKLLQAIKIVDPSPHPPPPLPPQLSTEDIVLSSEKTEDLWRCIRHVWETRPRARDQLRVVLWKYIEELSDEEIATQLNKTSAQVHVLRSRGMKKLRQCMTEQGHAVSRRPSVN